MATKSRAVQGGMIMREILFRGKRTDNGEWVYGYLLKGKLAYIVTDADMEYMVVSLACTACMELVEVIPETVGQFTGLTDKNGKKIFEGDIVKVPYFKISFEVKFVKERARFLGEAYKWELISLLYSHMDIEVIGNIHDNPELLKGDEKRD